MHRVTTRPRPRRALRVPRSTLAAATAAATALVGVCLAAPSARAVAPGSRLVISEVYGGGGNAGAPYSNDFIELYNAGAGPVDLGGDSVQYASAAGTAWTATTLSGEIQPGQYLLVQEGAGSTPSAPLPTPDVTGTLNLSGTSGKVALVDGTTPLVCGATCSTADGVVDFVGYGSAGDAAGGHATPALSNTTSAQRTTSPFTNTGDNAADFTVAAPTPKAPPVAGAPNPCGTTPLPAECSPDDTTIQDVQGDGFVSPLDGDQVAKVPGIVTGVRTSGSRGFWIQEASPDTADTSASSGVFVYSAAPVSVGDSVLVTGQVKDYYALSSGETLATTSSLSVTEIVPTLVTTVTTDNPLPAAVTITPTTVPGTYAPTVAGGNVETVTTVDPARSALEFWEAHEGMRVTVVNARVVGPGKTQYGEIYVTTAPDELATPRGGTYLPSYAGMPTGRLLVMPVNGVVPAANVGDELAGATTGPVDWSTFGGYAIAATTLGTYVDNHLQPTSATAQGTDQLAVATFNVENLAPTDPVSKYATLGSIVESNLEAPDIICVEEIQDNSGATDDGTVVADQTLTKLTGAIATAGGPAYQWKEIDPVDDEDGGQPGGNIRSVFLYNPDRVRFVDRTAGGSTQAVSVSTGTDGTPELSVNPGRVDPTNAAWDSSRKPLAGEFVFDGRKVIVVANHLNSKGGDQNADGRFQPPTRSSEVQRTEQATVLNGFVKQVLAADPSANLVLAGDFNDYQFSGPVRRLTDDGHTLLDLIDTLPADQRYTYNYNGISQVLDHIFLSRAITDHEYDVVHVNSEFAVQSSDHDPQVVRVRPAAQPSRLGTMTLDPVSVRQGGSTTATLRAWDANATLTIALDGSRLGAVTTDDHGSATYAVPVASTTSPGGHTVTATAWDGVAAAAPLTVFAAVKVGTVRVSPGRQHAGLPVRVTLRDFARNAVVRLSLDGGATLGSPVTNKHGKATSDVTIPRTTPVGIHEIVAEVSDGGSASDTVTVLRR